MFRENYYDLKLNNKCIQIFPEFFLKIDVHYFLQITMSVATSFYVGHKPMYLEPRPLSLIVTITSIFHIFFSIYEFQCVFMLNL